MSCSYEFHVCVIHRHSTDIDFDSFVFLDQFGK